MFLKFTFMSFVACPFKTIKQIVRFPRSRIPIKGFTRLQRDLSFHRDEQTVKLKQLMFDCEKIISFVIIQNNCILNLAHNTLYQISI